jgi:hypothetical protein
MKPFAQARGYHQPEMIHQRRKRRPKPNPTWHLDEVYLKIDGRMVYLWRAVDAEGEVLDVLVQANSCERFSRNRASFPISWSPMTCGRMALLPAILGIENHHERG